ncbi:MAG: hypothetical protein ABH868_01255 [bacterium]
MMGFIRNILCKMRNLLTGGRFLCDTCRYDYGNACLRRERPNATCCSDYKKR